MQLLFLIWATTLFVLIVLYALLAHFKKVREGQYKWFVLAAAIIWFISIFIVKAISDWADVYFSVYSGTYVAMALYGGFASILLFIGLKLRRAVYRQLLMFISGFALLIYIGNSLYGIYDILTYVPPKCDPNNFSVIVYNADPKGSYFHQLFDAPVYMSNCISEDSEE